MGSWGRIEHRCALVRGVSPVRKLPRQCEAAAEAVAPLSTCLSLAADVSTKFEFLGHLKCVWEVGRRCGRCVGGGAEVWEVCGRWGRVREVHGEGRGAREREVYGWQCGERGLGRPKRERGVVRTIVVIGEAAPGNTSR